MRTAFRFPTLLGLLVASLFFGGCRQRVTTVPTPHMEAFSNTWVRVRLNSEAASCKLVSESGATIVAGEEQMQAGSTAGGEIISISAAPGGFNVNGRVITTRRLTVSAEKPHIIALNGKSYRGNMTLLLAADGSRFEIINEVPLEAYLAGVVGAEMPSYWEPAALRSQAVAARTYCLFMKQRSVNRTWDVAATQASQVYGGLATENANIWNAVNATAGMVLVTDTPQAKDVIFPTYFSAVCGGHTESSENVFGDKWQSMPGVPCPYCKDVARVDNYLWPMVTYDASEASAILSEKYSALRRLGKIVSILPTQVSRYDVWSRNNFVQLTGATGETAVLRAGDLRLALDPTGMKLKSTSSIILVADGKIRFLAGRGWGHGTGMCQSGAQGMARKGATWEQILAHYYPNSRLKNINAIP